MKRKGRPYPLPVKRRRVECVHSFIWVFFNSAILAAILLWFFLFLSIVKVYIEKSIYIP